ncbi:MAG TPA: STAS/SEC14 domain-containing protein [Burkholderiales bacterium]
MLIHELLQDEGILIIRPQGALEAADFEALAKDVDPYIEAHGRLRGLVIQAQSFPGWSDFAALLSHFRFVRDHHRLIARVAAVSDSALLSFGPRIASHFVAAEVRHFRSPEREQALAWVRQG